MRIRQTVIALATSLVTSMAMAQSQSPDRVLQTDDPIVNRGTGSFCAGLTLLNQAPNQSNGIFSDQDCDFCNGGAGGAQVLAENFTLSGDAVIAELIIWGGFFPTNVPANENWTVVFHSDAAGLPGTVIDSQTGVASTRVDTGIDLFGVDEYRFNLSIAPVALSAGTYHLEIFANTAGSAESIFWEVANPDTIGNGIIGSSFAFEAPGVTWNADATDDLALQMCGPLPPPAIVPTMSRVGLFALIAVLMIGGVVVLRRRSNG